MAFEGRHQAEGLIMNETTPNATNQRGMTLLEKIAEIEALSRTRSLTERESKRLEDCMRRAGLIPKPTGTECSRGHEMTGDNVINDRGSVACRECRREDRRNSNARAKLRAKQREANNEAAALRSNGWTLDELRQLRVAYEMGWTDAMIGKHLNRSPQAVKTTRARYKICGVGTRPVQVNACTEQMAKERKRGEALLDRALGGKPRVDVRPANPVKFIVPASAYRGIPSTAAMAVS